MSGSLWRKQVLWLGIALTPIPPIYFFVNPNSAMTMGDQLAPELLAGERVWIEPYSASGPKLGDIVSFRWSEHDFEGLLRIAAGPGARVAWDEKGLTVDGQRRPWLGAEECPAPKGERTVAKESFFVVGNCRAAQSDSRTIGDVAMSKIRGRATRIIFSVDAGMVRVIRWRRLGRKLSAALAEKMEER